MNTSDDGGSSKPDNADGSDSGPIDDGASHADDGAGQPGTDGAGSGEGNGADTAASGGGDRDPSVASETGTAEKPARRSASDEYPPPATEQRIEVDNPGNRTTFPHDGLEPNTAYEVSGRGTYYTDSNGTVTHVETSYGSKRTPNPDLNNPAPNVTYVVNDRHVFVTDGLSRTIEVHVPQLELVAGTPRSSHIQGEVGRAGGPGHDGGHLVMNAAGGGRERINIVAMLEELNRSVAPGNKLTDNYYDLETLLRDKVSGGSDARLDLYIDYDLTRTPTHINAEYEIDGVPDFVRFDNGS